MFAFTNAFYGPGITPTLMDDIVCVNFSTRVFAFTNAFYGPGIMPTLMDDTGCVCVSVPGCSRSLTRSTAQT